jgi:phage terminase large subunit-like protein
VILGLDMSRSKDTTALTIVQPLEGGKFSTSSETWAAWPNSADDPPDVHHAIEGDTIPFATIFARVRELCGLYDVIEVAYDPFRITDDVSEQLEAEGLPMTKFPQSHTLMIPASEGLFNAVVEEKLEHAGDPIVDAHIAAAAAKDVPGSRSGWRLDKDVAHSPSDAAFSLAMALQRAREYGPLGAEAFVVRYG